MRVRPICTAAVLALTVGVVLPGVASAQDLDCSDFPTREAAQQRFDALGGYDPHRLDADGDGIACDPDDYQPAGTSPAPGERAGADPTRQNSTTPYPTRPNSADPYPTRPDPAGQYPARPEPTRSESARQDRSGEEPAGSDAAVEDRTVGHATTHPSRPDWDSGPAPRGPVEAGGGGMAAELGDPGDPGSPALALAGLGGLAAGAALVAARRWVRPRRS